MKDAHRYLAAAIVAALLVACTASPSPSPAASVSEAASATPTATSTPSELPAITDLLAAVQATIEQGTVHVDQTLEFAGSTVIPDETSVVLTGQATLGGTPHLRVFADFTELGAGALTMIRDGSLVYMRGTVFDDLVGADRWLLVDLESNDPSAAPFKSLASGQNDVSMALYYLYGVMAPVNGSPGSPIRGQGTTHYEMEIDLEAARDRIPAGQLEALEDLIAGLRTAGVDRQLEAEAWVGDDGFVQRVRFVYRLGRTQGGGSMETIVDFSEFGGPLDLQIPSGEEVVPIEDAVSS